MIHAEWILFFDGFSIVDQYYHSSRPNTADTLILPPTPYQLTIKDKRK